MTNKQLTLKLGDGERGVSLAMVSETLECWLDLLNSITRELVPQGDNVQWEVVEASLRSPMVLGIGSRVEGKTRADRTIGKKVAVTAVRGMRQLEARPVLPRHFNQESLNAAEKLVRRPEREKTRVAISTPNRREQELVPSEKTLEHIREVLDRTWPFVDYGAVEGFVEIVSVHEHKSFFVFEVLTRTRVECIITTPEQLKEAIALLEKRVSVEGRIRYRNNKPISVTVERVRRLRDRNELPQHTDFRIDITEGVSSEEHVRRMRDAR